MTPEQRARAETIIHRGYCRDEDHATFNILLAEVERLESVVEARDLELTRAYALLDTIRGLE
jgi:hypothetical protein